MIFVPKRSWKWEKVAIQRNWVCAEYSVHSEERLCLLRRARGGDLR